MRVFMLLPGRVTALRVAAQARALGPCPGRRGPGLRAEHGSPGTAPARRQLRLADGGASDSRNPSHRATAQPLDAPRAALYNLTRGRARRGGALHPRGGGICPGRGASATARANGGREAPGPERSTGRA